MALSTKASAAAANKGCGKRMGKYLLYSEDPAGFVALNVLKEKQHSVLGVIDCSGRLIQQALDQGFAVCQNMEILPNEALNQVDGIMIGVATEPLATQLKKELKAKFPEKRSALCSTRNIAGLSSAPAILPRAVDQTGKHK